MTPKDDVTRRDVLRIGTAVLGGKTLVDRAAATPSATGNNRVEPTFLAQDSDRKLYTGYVLLPDYGTYDESVPFQIVIRFRESHASIGRGGKVCQKPRQAYITYGIRYRDSEQTTAFLAVPLDNRQDVLPHEYFVPQTRFHFVETDGKYVFAGDCDTSPTLVQHGVFTRVALSD